MTETIVISQKHIEAFKEACKHDKIDFEIIGEGIDGDTYKLTFDYPSQLFYLGRMMQLMIAKERILKGL